MKVTDFSKALTDFLMKYLPSERNVSTNTIKAYKDTFILFITFMQSQKGIKAYKIDLSCITKASIVEYLDWLQNVRNNCNATRNMRLAAIRSFFKYLQYEHPEHMFQWQQILSIPVKNAGKGTIAYLTLDAIKAILSMPDPSSKKGRRDLAMLSLMYDSGARVQEIIDLTPLMVRLEAPCTLKLIGKGNKARIVPLIDNQVMFLRQYMDENKLLLPHANNYPLFSNSRKEKLTRAGMNYILLKYVNLARMNGVTSIPPKISCHSLRHSKAMHLLQADVNLVYIRDILGHTSIKTTEIYARVDSARKREAIENAYAEVAPKSIPRWLGNSDLLDWLKEL